MGPNTLPFAASAVFLVSFAALTLGTTTLLVFVTHQLNALLSYIGMGVGVVGAALVTWWFCRRFGARY